MNNGAPIYLENKEGQTACDIAVEKNFRPIAEFLESKMVFNVSEELKQIFHCGQIFDMFYCGWCHDTFVCVGWLKGGTSRLIFPFSFSFLCALAIDMYKDWIVHRNKKAK